MKWLRGLGSLIVVFACAAEAGAGDPTVIAAGEAPAAPQQPQICLDAEGRVHLTFGQGDDVYYCNSSDGAKTFNSPVKLPSAKDISLGMRRGPRIAVASKTICISVIGGEQGKGRDGDLLAFRSTDNGKTWSGPVAVNDAPDAAREGLHAMAAGPEGRLCCVWLDLRSKGTELYGSTSTDGGATWSKNALVYRSPDGSICECCHPSVAFSADGRLHVLWRNSVTGARDMYASSSTDGGLTFSRATKVGSGTWPLKACPMDGGGIAVLRDGKPATVWRRNKTVFLAIGEEAEQSLTTGEQPVLAAASAGPVVAWLTKRGGPLLYQPSPKQPPKKLAETAGDPVIVSDGDHATFVAWESHEGATIKIVCQAVDE